MPIYEYKCNTCSKISEFLEGVGQERIEKLCKHCGAKNLSKIFSKSFVSTSGHIIGSQGGTTCCGRTERCEKPPCSDDGTCKR